MSDAEALNTFVQIAAADARSATQVAARSTDVMTVASINEGRVSVQPIDGLTEQAVAILEHVSCEVGDEVLVQRIGRRWIVTGVISATMGGA